MDLQNLQRIYFLGIGGIGMSALARFFHQAGVRVSGYDRTATALTRQLVAEGIPVSYLDHDPLPEDVELVVFTPAVPRTHPCFEACAHRGLPLMKRAEALGLISRSHRCIAVAGTHGKTTTSAILTHLLRSGGLDCSAFLGGISTNYGTNFLLGSSEWVVVEADEYDRSFLHLYPSLLILNALDPDHLDIYGDAEAMRQTYYQLIRQVKPGGTLLLRTGLEVPPRIWADLPITVRTFGEEPSDYQVLRIRQEGPLTLFDLQVGPDLYRDLVFTLPGRHNVNNAAASFAAGLLLGLAEAELREGLHAFRGVERRFQLHYDQGGVSYVDDYAHHPEELAGLIQAARSRFPGRRITGIFQPHLFSRTRDFDREFAEVLDRLDEPLVTDIYPAREEPIPGIDAQYLLGLMKHPQRRYVPRHRILEFLSDHPLDVLITAGAGDVDALIPEIIQLLKNRYP
jgi:UDP-N-acetylmuramate--alanine ligase